MANFEAWTNLTEVGKLLFTQNYAIEEIQSLKPKPGTSAETAKVHKDRLHSLFALFMINQERVNSIINPAHRQFQLNLTERIRKLVTSHLQKLMPIIHNGEDEPISIELYPNSDSPSVLNFPETWTNETNMQDWIAYENYLILSQKVRDFNILCSSVPHDILPLIKRFDKEGATAFELEEIVHLIRSDNMDFDQLIEAEIKKIEKYRSFDEDSVEQFERFVEKANQAMRILIVCDAEAEESNDDRVMSMVKLITERFPRVVKGKWVKEVEQGDDVSSLVKLRNFLLIPVKDLMQEKAVVEKRWFGGIFGRFLGKILSMFRWW